MKIILIAILAGLVIIAGAFYWYEYRPTQIRKECNKPLSSQLSEKFYQSCLRSHGIEK